MTDQNLESYFPNSVSKDLLELMRGRWLGSGVHREVYVCRQDETCVIKFETEAGNFSNILEWKFWQDMKDCKKVADWLAPCVGISANGSILLQKRTMPLAPDAYPIEIPKFLTDTKRGNFGWLDGRVVCHDYASTIVNVNERLRKAEWW